MNIKQKLSAASPPGRYRLFHLLPRVILVQPHPAAQHPQTPKIRKSPFLWFSHNCRFRLLRKRYK